MSIIMSIIITMMKIADATTNMSITMNITSEMKKSMSVAAAVALMMMKKRRKNIITGITMSIMRNIAAAIMKMRSTSIMMSHAHADTIMSIIITENIAAAVMIMMPMRFLRVSV